EVGRRGAGFCGAGGRAGVWCGRRPAVAARGHRLSMLRWRGLFAGAYRRYRARDGDFRTTRPVEVLMGAALFMPRRVFRECGPWDEGYTFGGEDIDLCARVGRRHGVVYHPDVEFTHYGRVSNRQRIRYA